MKMRKTIYSKMDFEIKYKTVWQFIKAMLFSVRYCIMTHVFKLTINGKDYGSFNIVAFPRFKFIRAGE